MLARQHTTRFFAAGRNPIVSAIGLAAYCIALCIGCRAQQPAVGLPGAAPAQDLFRPSLSIESPRLETEAAAAPPLTSPPPRTIDSPPATEFREVTLADAIRFALNDNQIMRSLGGQAIAAPANLTTTYEPAIIETDPLYGPQGALSEFDPQFTSNMMWITNDRALNNILQGGGVRQLQEKQWNYESGLKKIAATGTQFTLKGIAGYDSSNATGNLYPSAWDTQLETGIRHPFLQGGGIDFNRIAGPKSQPGFNFSNGVLLARLRTDLSLADFETGVATYVNDVEGAYWGLYYAYREFESRTLARDAAWEAWQYVRAKHSQGLLEAEVNREADAREKFFQAQDELEEALAGSGEKSEGMSLYAAERRLRRLLGLPLDDGKLIRPADSPPEVSVRIDWSQASAEALARRAELRKQRWVIKQRELELIAARNFTLPNLDGVATHRVRGFGDVLTSGTPSPQRQYSSLRDLSSFEHQEWQVGLEFLMPLGFRKGMAAVRHSELQLARERSVLREQEHEILHELGEAVAALSRNYSAVGNAQQRLVAAEQLFQAAQVSFQAEKLPMDQWSGARTRLAEARKRYYRSLIEYAEAVRSTEKAKGSLLDYHGVYLNEGRWANGAARDAAEASRRWRTPLIDYRMTLPPPVADRQSVGVSVQEAQPPMWESVPAESSSEPQSTTPVAAPLSSGELESSEN
jgi:outer membrane protein TolC